MTTSTYIDVGLNPNDGTGDSIRDAFIKTNTYFNNLSQVLSTLTGVAVNIKVSDLLDTPKTYWPTGQTSKLTVGPTLLGVNNAANSYVNREVTASGGITIDPPTDANFNIRMTYTASVTATAYTLVLRDGTGSILGNPGYAGSVGGIGYTGSASTAPGYEGSRGYVGSVGYTGSSGSNGSLGYTGSVGSGYTGSASTAAGIQGYYGSIGYTGSGASNANFATSSSYAGYLNPGATINGVAFTGQSNISFTTDSVTQGSTNLYFSNTLARGAVSGGTGISYTPSTGVIANSGIISASAGSGIGVSVSSGALTISNSGVTQLATSGSGISVNAGTGNITLTSNATNANTGNTLVYRDASGNFSAGTITATLSGSATTAGSAGSATTAGSASQITLGTYPGSGTFYPTFVSATSGNATEYVDSSNFSYNAGTLTAVDFSATSDARLKNVVGPITDAVSKIKALNGVVYYWNDLAKSKGIVNTDLQLGVLAQDVQAVAPEAVSEVDGSLRVSYDKLVPVLIEAVKELNDKLDKLLGNR